MTINNSDNDKSSQIIELAVTQQRQTRQRSLFQFCHFTVDRMQKDPVLFQVSFVFYQSKQKCNTVLEATLNP
jgi:hypothetical protein